MYTLQAAYGTLDVEAYYMTMAITAEPVESMTEKGGVGHPKKSPAKNKTPARRQGQTVQSTKPITQKKSRGKNDTPARRQGRTVQSTKPIIVKRNVTDLMKGLVAEQQKHRCAHCNRKLSRMIRQIDHITPLMQGGDNTRDNLQALCPNCHAYKTAKERLPPDFVRKR